MTAVTAGHLVGLTAAVLVGAGTQRITGLGFALVASPFIVLLTDPFNGVLLVNGCGTVTALVVLVQVWRDVDTGRAGRLLVPALLTVPAGAWTARHLAAPLLAVLVGGLVLLALTAVLVSARFRRLREASGPATSGQRGALLAGAGSGFMNVTAGVGGPALTVYAISTGWPQRSFAATAQLIFAALGAASLAAKGSLPSLPPTGWIAVGAALLVGIVAGDRVAGRVPAHRARQAVVVLALAGAAVTVCKGVIQL